MTDTADPGCLLAALVLFTVIAASGLLLNCLAVGLYGWHVLTVVGLVWSSTATVGCAVSALAVALALEDR